MARDPYAWAAQYASDQMQLAGRDRQIADKLALAPAEHKIALGDLALKQRYGQDDIRLRDQLDEASYQRRYPMELAAAEYKTGLETEAYGDRLRMRGENVGEQQEIAAMGAMPEDATGASIYQGARRYGIDPAAMATIAHLESRGDPNAKNPRSSAGGLFQFIDSTAEQYGLHGRDRYDPHKAADAAARLAANNAKILRNTLSREPTAGELYLAHQQGAGGARSLLGNPNARAADIVGTEAVRLNGGRLDMSAKEFANLWINKAERVYAQNKGRNALPKIDAQTETAVASAPGFDPFIVEQLQATGRKPVRQVKMSSSQFELLPPEMKANLVPDITAAPDRYGNVPYIWTEQVAKPRQVASMANPSDPNAPSGDEFDPVAELDIQ